MAALTKESAGEYVLRFAVPGFGPEELDVEASDHVVTVRGDRTGTGRDASRLHDRLIERLELPVDADTDRVTASYEPDALELHAPRFPGGSPPAHKVAIRRRYAVNPDASGAPGIKYRAWAFSGGAPAPFIHVRQGQRVDLTLTNKGVIPHSVDFHAARIGPNVAFRDVQPGGSIHYSFVAKDPGAFMFHCGTKPVLAHIANGMYGAIIVEPRTPLLPADKNYVLVASEWYLSSKGFPEPASLDMAKAQRQEPDWVTWNGYAGQYVTHPLTAEPGQTVRFWVVDAGPSFDVDFHIVGTILNRAWVNGDMMHFQRNVQTVLVPAGGGGVFDVKIDQPGLYSFVSHSFAAVDLGQVGLLNVGNVKGTMSH